MTHGAIAIAIEGLDFACQPGRPVLHGLDLQIAPRSFHGIVGHTGSGKSTLLALLLRFYPAPVPAAAARGGRSAQEHFRTR